ncbi:sigma-70 family RNA polymerase sigma factor [Candidatus Poribacteria bacterium]|nr:sigma-70 family RNA polymerase sigma factor [Candidatus Poribacteria bacterium]
MYNQVVEENYRNMIEYCVHSFRDIDTSTAEDLVQEVFTELLEAILEGIKKKEVQVRRWLFQHLRWKCLNYVRSIQRFPPEEAEDTQDETSEEDIIDRIPAPGPSPHEIAEGREIHKFLRDCIKNRLKGRTQEVIKLVLQEGLSQVEVARQLGITQQRVAQLKRRGIFLLRKWSREAGFFDD